MYIIGDIHGCYKTFKKLLKQIPKNSKIISVGDLVDKGPNSCDVLDLVISLDNFQMVLGNHELYFIEVMENWLNNDISKEELELNPWYSKYGGKQTFDSYFKDANSVMDTMIAEKKLRKHINYLKKQTYYIYLENEKILISHGFALPYFENKDNIEKNLMIKQFTCNRVDGDFFNLLDKKNVEYIESLGILNIFGHDAHENIKFKKSHICLDTGCVYGNKLSAYNPIKKTIIYVDNIDRISYRENIKLH